MLKVQSIFKSLDGEANGYQNSGQPTTFIRLRGCNLRCKWCDTVYAQDPEKDGYQEMSVSEILRQVEGMKITLTGGEPLSQGGEVVTLISRLMGGWKEVSVETNGSISLTNFGLCYLPRNKTGDHGSVRFVMDYKLPSSEMEHRMDVCNFRVLQPEDVVKFVVADDQDFERMLEVYQERWRQQCCKAKIAVSPAIAITPQGPDLRWAATLAEKVINLPLRMTHPVLFSLQIHKVLWPHANERNER